MQRPTGWLTVVAGLGLAACGADDAEPVVADTLPELHADGTVTPVSNGRYDLSCYGQDPPNKAADPVVLDAFNYDSYGIGPLADSVVDLVAIDDDRILDRTISDEGGGLSFDIPTNGAPLHHYTRTALDGFVTSYVYPSGPLVADELNRALPLLPPTWRAELAAFAGITLEPEAGIVEVIVTDCLGMRVEGATVTFEPAGDVVAYFDPTFTDTSATATTDNGHAWAFNVPAGVVDATITLGDLTWRARPVRSFADSRTLSWRAP